MRPTRFEVMDELRRLLDHSEQTEILIDWLQDAWQTYDVLIERVGRVRAYQMINAPETAACCPTERDVPASGPPNCPSLLAQ